MRAGASDYCVHLQVQLWWRLHRRLLPGLNRHLLLRWRAILDGVVPIRLLGHILFPGRSHLRIADFFRQRCPPGRVAVFVGGGRHGHPIHDLGGDVSNVGRVGHVLLERGHIPAGSVNDREPVAAYARRTPAAA